MEMKAISSQSSDWSVEHTDTSQYQHSPTTNTNISKSYIHENQNNSENYKQHRFTLNYKACECCSTVSPIIKGLVLGILTGGLVLAVITTVWLTSVKTSNSSETSFTTSTTVNTTRSSLNTGTSGNTSTNSSTSIGSGATTTIRSGVSTSISSSTSATVRARSSASTSASTAIASTTTTTTTQNPIIASLSGTNLSSNAWAPYAYSYLASTSANMTITFTFQGTNKNNWYFDDASVKDPTSVEMLTNGDFETMPSLTGWSIGPSGACTSASGLTTSVVHSPSQSFYVKCSSSIRIAQSFAAISGETYNVTFWLYMEHSGGNSGTTNPTYIYIYTCITYGNYGYGIYSQDVELYRNPYTGRLNVEREVDFIPIGNNYYQPITGIPAAIHQHYIN
ncbi:unnamed protein product [Adineta steineri]|uniref:Uncharacterized protein n=1 Tax=Adineta steineri TaxID=433720 RepID=A0A813Q4J5_9BILA|nr:unnamed protein product [Adineta steineri]